jgi:hypothetical protein
MDEQTSPLPNPPLPDVDDDSQAPECPPPQPWDCQPDETPRAFRAFVIYRDLGPKRSLRAVQDKLDLLEAEQSIECGVFITQQALHRLQTGRSRTISSHIERWSSKLHWVQRSRDWDCMIDMQLQSRTLDAVEKMARNHAVELEAGRAAIISVIQELLIRLRTAEGKKEVSSIPMLKHMSLALAAAAKLPQLQAAERTARRVQECASEQNQEKVTRKRWFTVVKEAPTRERVIDPDLIFAKSQERSTIADDVEPKDEDDDGEVPIPDWVREQNPKLFS